MSQQHRPTPIAVRAICMYFNNRAVAERSENRVGDVMQYRTEELEEVNQMEGLANNNIATNSFAKFQQVMYQTAEKMRHRVVFHIDKSLDEEEKLDALVSWASKADNLGGDLFELFKVKAPAIKEAKENNTYDQIFRDVCANLYSIGHSQFLDLTRKLG
eukprot:gene12533-14494_t